MKLDAVRNELIRKKRLATEEANRKMRKRLDRAVPVKTGELRDSIKSTVKHSRDISTITVTAGGPGIPQAETTEKGARPHVIKAKNASALTFYWPKVGRVVSFKQVNHPGNAPQPWFFPTLDDWPSVIDEAWRQTR